MTMLTLGAAVGAEAAPTDSAVGAALTEVIEADRLLNRLILARDAAGAAALYDDDFVLTAGSGLHKSKADMLADITDPGVRLEVSETLLPRVLLRGDTAVLYGVLVEKGMVQGRILDVRLHVTDTWVRRKPGHWLLLAGHASLARKD